MIWTRRSYRNDAKPPVPADEFRAALAEEPTQAAAARRLGVSPAAVCQRLRRARERAEREQARGNR